MQQTAVAVGSYAWEALAATLVQIFTVLGPAIVLAFVMNLVARASQRGGQQLLGEWYLRLFGWLGTAVHESGHALFCVLFGHRITDICFFEPDPAKRHGGTLGYVAHAYDPKNLYHLVGNLFIGIGPIILGTAVLYGAAWFLLGDEVVASVSTASLESSTFTSFASAGVFLDEVGTGTWSLLGSLFTAERTTSWEIYLFLYVAFSVGSSISLSRPDVESALHGFGVLFALVLLFNLATLHAGDFAMETLQGLGHVTSTVYGVMLLALVVNACITVVVVAMPWTARKLARGR
ncbi:MAG: hypothetical protein ACQEXJ_21115 [Myxococcota bacterium]